MYSHTHDQSTFPSACGLLRLIMRNCITEHNKTVQADFFIFLTELLNQIVMYAFTCLQIFCDAIKKEISRTQKYTSMLLCIQQISFVKVAVVY